MQDTKRLIKILLKSEPKRSNQIIPRHRGTKMVINTTLEITPTYLSGLSSKMTLKSMLVVEFVDMLSNKINSY